MNRNKQYMNSLKLKLVLTYLSLLAGVLLFAKEIPKTITVSKNGKSDFKTIQEAINSVPANSISTQIISIKNGVYHEKISIEKNNIVLKGENEDSTIITQAIARDEFRCEHKDDWGVATMNLNGNDITLENLTVQNTYGFDATSETITVNCAADSTGKKTIGKTGHQMALRTMRTTRLKVIKCHFKAFGGDTVSPWNVEDGLFYFKDCIMEGGVDFFCPRGWSYAENCTFIAHTGPASIWHDGSKYKTSKTVLKNCKFTGFDNFNLGRYHRDAQFFLIGCTFAQNMADKDIYLVPTNNIIQWGRRVYYYNCHREKGNDFNWFKNNLETSDEKPNPNEIYPNWVFENKWVIN